MENLPKTNTNFNFSKQEEESELFNLKLYCKQLIASVTKDNFWDNVYFIENILKDKIKDSFSLKETKKKLKYKCYAFLLYGLQAKEDVKDILGQVILEINNFILKDIKKQGYGKENKIVSKDEEEAVIESEMAKVTIKTIKAFDWKILDKKIKEHLKNSQFKIFYCPKFLLSVQKKYYIHHFSINLPLINKTSDVECNLEKTVNKFLKDLNLFNAKDLSIDSNSNMNFKLNLKDFNNLDFKILNLLLEVLFLANYKIIDLEKFKLLFEGFFYFSKSLENLHELINKEENEQEQLQQFIENKILTLKLLIKGNYQEKETNRYLDSFYVLFTALTLNMYSLIKVDVDLNIIFNDSNSEYVSSPLKRELLNNLIAYLDDYINEIDFYLLLRVINFNLSEMQNLRSFFTSKYNEKILSKELNKNEMNFSFLNDLILSECNDKVILHQFKHLIGSAVLNSKGNKEGTNESSNKLDPLQSVFNLFSKFKKTTNKAKEESSNYNSNIIKNENKYLVESCKLYPYLGSFINPHVYICVSGFMSELDNDFITWERFVSGLSKYSDCYLYKWDSETHSNLTYEVSSTVIDLINNYRENKPLKDYFNTLNNYKDSNLFNKTRKKSKFFGKFLAYILADRIIFKFHSISLIAFSLGCNVIKSCLKELFKIFLKTNNLNIINLIQNVILLGGATSFVNFNKWKEYLKLLVKGKIVNVHSNNDLILKGVYYASTGKCALGAVKQKELEESLNNFYNVDLSYTKIGHGEYRENMEMIVDNLKHNLNII